MEKDEIVLAMSLDKFVMRGFTGSVGSGEGRWVASSSSSQQASSSVGRQHQSGSSFVLGGGGAVSRSGSSSKGKASYSEHDSSRGEAMGGGDRYSYDPDKVRNGGTQHDYGKHPGCFGSKSLNDAANSRQGHQVVVGMLFFGIALFVTIFCIVAVFGNGGDDDFYKLPGSSRKAKPMWARDR